MLLKAVLCYGKSPKQVCYVNICISPIFNAPAVPLILEFEMQPRTLPMVDFGMGPIDV